MPSWNRARKVDWGRVERLTHELNPGAEDSRWLRNCLETTLPRTIGAWSYGRLGEALCQDIAQDAIVKYLSHLARVPDCDRGAAIFYRTVRNTHTDVWRAGVSSLLQFGFDGEDELDGNGAVATIDAAYFKNHCRHEKTNDASAVGSARRRLRDAFQAAYQALEAADPSKELQLILQLYLEEIIFEPRQPHAKRLNAVRESLRESGLPQRQAANLVAKFQKKAAAQLFFSEVAKVIP